MSVDKAHFQPPMNAEGKRWRGPGMVINSEPGTPIIFHGASKAQIDWGGGKTDPNGLLDLGKEYTLAAVDIHSYHTNVRVEGFPQWFPSSAFHHVDANDKWEKDDE